MGVRRRIFALYFLGDLLELFGFRGGGLAPVGGRLAGLSIGHGLRVEKLHPVSLCSDGVGVSELAAQP
ncbi:MULTISPECIES: hypothetical protein [unclassified Streptomyces]|uniref:hypothetical protein n=1 Tax=unclassified Streptomyces TaxID=2593676 RepID=UPI00114CDC50|nr:hypothetical protein [Streptomyces sp. BvitLS-983]MYX83957.1 hypothetical protein [Streptomyces sp. SID4915]